jgi:hypothetical protein
MVPLVYFYRLEKVHCGNFFKEVFYFYRATILVFFLNKEKVGQNYDKIQKIKNDVMMGKGVSLVIF